MYSMLFIQILYIVNININLHHSVLYFVYSKNIVRFLSNIINYVIMVKTDSFKVTKILITV